MVGYADEESMSMSMPSKLPLILSFPVHSPVHEAASSGCSTPPFHSSVSVPFKWEEEPGKPIHSTALIPFAQPISLQLIPPPGMSRVDPKATKTPSPTTVLDGPCPERGLLGPMVMMMSNSEKKKNKKKKRLLFGSWSWGSISRNSTCKKMLLGDRDEGLGGSFVFPSSASTAAAKSFEDGRECCSEYGGESECVVGEAVKMSKMKKSRSFINFAQVIPWKAGSKPSKDVTSTSSE